ncbi:uncharacterized protein PITG_05726 [Phytophthora infestans T30-4]|uniref:Transmembrane protein n=1 Tax=Phytophthora infestans (strain T30-4) TaxID=403677 RepID=D0N5J2_PHYIT|nr:uncharacterized protein PITG_05726 [Phytophthora infestans T30-4]EEY70333.1 conserved hypothetical protein [Phytophthora infestans T30-4]|eukprot:XP_002997987.1 conserved hypothetical protein [Phytophthora infestans T30-4]
MILPFDNSELHVLPPVPALTYETVLCMELPAFDPVPTLRSVLLKPPHLQRFACFLRKTGWLTMTIYGCGLILRIVVCSVPAPIGRLVSPWAAVLHIPPCIVFAAGIRVEFVKLILSAFDFWFPFAANTMFLVIFSCVLRDMRTLLVIAVWIAFGCSFLQETYFRDSRNIAMSAFVEASLLVLLMGSISLNVMDDLHHSNLIIAGGHTLSTKDVLINVIGTMATLMMRTMYRRVKLIKRQKKMKGTATQSLGYRCFIALNPTGPGATLRNSVVPHPLGPLLFFHAKSTLSRSKQDRISSRHLSSNLVLPPLQIHLVKNPRHYDPRDTLWRCVGSVEPLHVWQALVLQFCGGTGFLLTIPAPVAKETEVMGLLCLSSTVVFYAVNLFCCQRLIAAHLCLADILSYRWTSTCGVAASYLWAQWSLTIDALTPAMRHRLLIKNWMPTCCIALFIVIQLLASLDILVLDYSHLRDRVFWDLNFLGRKAQFRVVTFLWSRVVTIFVWYGRLLYILVTRTHENALIILRGNVEFDYQTWRLQANIAREVRRMAKFAKSIQVTKAAVTSIPE